MGIHKMAADSFYPSQSVLGEGPMWHSGRKTCFWVDIETKQFFEFDWLDHTMKSRKLAYRISLIIEDNSNQLLLGLQGGIAKYDLLTDRLHWLIDIEKEYPDHRCNDGVCDNRGRLWIGTMQLDFNQGAGSFYCVDEKLNLSRKIKNVTISNGVAWSLDNTRMYYIDSPTQSVQAFRYDEYSADIRFEKVVIDIPRGLGTPDGMAIDEEGMLWIAHWGGFGVFRWNPADGKMIGSLKLPVPNVSSCAFVGEERDHLLITTAREKLTDQELKMYPESGNVFIASPGVKGIAPYKSKI
jgi:sugar lactone lactonase YvrE